MKLPLDFIRDGLTDDDDVAVKQGHLRDWAREIEGLRGTLRYIAVQAKAGHPGALRVIAANADVALGGGLADNLRSALAALNQTNRERT